MENKFECGNAVLLRVTVNAVYNEGSVYDYDVSYLNHDTGEEELIPVIEEQLTTASVSPNIDWQAKYNEYNEKAEAKIRELANKLNEMDELLKDAQSKAIRLNSALKAQNDANLELEDKNALLSRKNRELEETLSNWDGNVGHWRTKYMNMKKSRNEYKRAADHLKEERDRADDELALTRIMNMALAEKIERLQSNG